jgi:hypothetical protein
MLSSVFESAARNISSSIVFVIRVVWVLCVTERTVFQQGGAPVILRCNPMKHAFFSLAAVLIFATGLSAQTKIQAEQADKFVDSMGINVHMESPTLPYSDYSSVNAQLQSLRMRHIRDEMNQADPYFKNQPFIDEIQAIGALGYTLTGLIEGGNDYPEPVSTRLEADHVVPMILNLLPTIDAVEGPNEPDDPTPLFFYNGPCDPKEKETTACYPLGAIQESEDLWHIVKDSHVEGSEKIKSLPVLAMSEGTAGNFTMLANLVKEKKIPPAGDYTMIGNMHAYQGGLLGDGLGPNSSLDWYIRTSQQWTGTEPLWTTEMGYHNNIYFLYDGEQQGVSERASAIYLPIAFLSGFNKGVVRTFSYELLDETEDAPQAGCTPNEWEKNPRCQGNGYYGLLKYDTTSNPPSFSPKPAFTALKNLIELLQDPESSFTPGTLEITFSADPGKKEYKLEYTLLQKSNGDYYLAIWNDVSVFQPASAPGSVGMDIYPPNVPVTITTSEPYAFTVYAPNDSTGVRCTDRYTISTSSNSIKIDLPPEVLLIKIASH